MKIVIAVPSGDMVHADFAFSMNSMIIHTLMKAVPIVAIVNKKGSIIHQARCSLVDDARKAGATHIMFIDSDHVFPKDLIVRLAAANKDVIGVHSVTKRRPCRSNCEDMKYQRLTKPGVGVEEVIRLGTGLMLINMTVFDKMKMPYFNFKYENGPLARVRGWIGEDYYFCEKARSAGFGIFVDHDLSKECFHIGNALYGVQELELPNGK